MSYFFGQTPSLTPEGTRRKRELANAFMTGIGRPRNFGEGLSSIGNALAVRGLNKQADAAEDEGKSKANQLFSDLIAGRAPTQPSSSSGPMTVLGIPPRSEEQQIGDDAMAALGKDDAMSMEGRVLKGLTDRNMPEHVAEAFVMNFRDESGLNPGINEIEPLVPGSRGGFGLAQWTGPRRKQLEAFAAERGVPVDDLDLQLDFLVQELQGSEANAGRTILSTRNRSEAAQAIVNDFLRPAEEHRARRAAQYGGATSGPQTDNSQLYAALSNPWLDQNQRAVVLQMLQDNQQAADPLRQLQMERAQLELEQMRNPQQEKTTLMRNYEAAVQGGYQGDFVQYQTDIKKAGATQNNVTVGLGPNNTQTPYSQPVTPAQKKVDEEFAKTYVPWSQGGGADMASQIAQIETVAKQLEDGDVNLTGPGIGSMPDWLGTIVKPDAVAARETVENVVQRNLRLLLGAQFTAKEGEQLIARAYNPRLPEADNAKRLRRLSLAMQAAAQDTQSQVDYYQTHGTLTGWTGRQWTISDFEAAIEGDVPQQPAAAPESSAAPAIGTVQDGYRFLGGDPSDPNNWERAS